MFGAAVLTLAAFAAPPTFVPDYSDDAFYLIAGTNRFESLPEYDDWRDIGDVLDVTADVTVECPSTSYAQIRMNSAGRVQMRGNLFAVQGAECQILDDGTNIASIFIDFTGGGVQ